MAKYATMIKHLGKAEDYDDPRMVNRDRVLIELLFANAYGIAAVIEQLETLIQRTTHYPFEDKEAKNG